MHAYSNDASPQIEVTTLGLFTVVHDIFMHQMIIAPCSHADACCQLHGVCAILILLMPRFPNLELQSYYF